MYIFLIFHLIQDPSCAWDIRNNKCAPHSGSPADASALLQNLAEGFHAGCGARAGATHSGKTFLVKNHLSVHNLAPAATLSPFFSGFPPPVNLFTPRSVLGPVGRPQHGGEPPAGVQLRAEHEDGDVEGVLRENSLPRLCLLCPPLPPSWLPRRLLLLQTLQPRQRRQDELWPCISRGSGGNIFHLLSHRHQN